MSAESLHDLVIVGAGPAGLQAAVYARYEGIDALVLDSGVQIGGQAGMAKHIENDAAFPGGISGADMMARMADSAATSDTDYVGPTRAEELSRTDEGIAIRTDDGETYLSRTVLLSTGVELRRLNARNMAIYGGRGVNYGVIPRSVDYSGKKVVVIGGANSAGQGALTLADFDACEVDLLIRGDSIEEKMSRRLIDLIRANEDIKVRTNTTLTGVDGDGWLNKVTVKSGDGEETDMPADEVFVFIGSIPKTFWLPPSIATDERNYVTSSNHLSEEVRDTFMEETGGRPPYGHETSMPGVFVAGDVRSGTKRRIVVAKADGALAIDDVYNYLSSSTPEAE